VERRMKQPRGDWDVEGTATEHEPPPRHLPQ
jgi:hypothetical protein